MHTIPDKNSGKLQDAGREPRSPKFDYQKPDYGTGSAGPEDEETMPDIEVDLREAIEKIGTASRKDRIPEPEIDSF